MVVATVYPLADARGSYDAARAAAVKGCEKTRGYPRNVSGFFQVRAATVSTYVVRFLPKLAEFQREGDVASVGTMTSSLSLRPKVTTCLPSAVR